MSDQKSGSLGDQASPEVITPVASGSLPNTLADPLAFPEAWPEIGTLMSNFDHEIDEEIAAKLQSGNWVADYPGWHFHAKCWHESGKFHARVKQYHQVVGFYSAETPKELMDVVSSEYGHE